MRLFSCSLISFHTSAYQLGVCGFVGQLPVREELWVEWGQPSRGSKVNRP